MTEKHRELPKKIRRTCRVCKRRFKAKQRNRRYCSNSCRQRAWIDALRVFYGNPRQEVLPG